MGRRSKKRLRRDRGSERALRFDETDPFSFPRTECLKMVNSKMSSAGDTKETRSLSRWVGVISNLIASETDSPSPCSYRT